LTGIELVLTHIGYDGVTHFFGSFNLTTPTAPVYTAGNTSTNGLPSAPVACSTFNNRTYFACGNTAYYTDTLALNMFNSNQSLSFGDLTPITAMAPLPMGSTSQAIIQAVLLFKLTQVAQVTGDPITTNLAMNLLSPTVGTAAPRSVVPTPYGVRFMAIDGIRDISFYGFVSEPEPNICIPFKYAVTPSRVAAAYNSEIYRICVQNGAMPGSPFQDWWYSFKRGGWTGPHTFQYDVAAAFNGDFVIASNTLPGAIWDSYTDQGHQGGGTSFVENGTQLAFVYETSNMTDLNNIYANKVQKSTIEIALPASGETYNCTAQDEDGTVLAQGSITGGTNQAIWGQFTWGRANWGASTSGLKPFTIPWNQAVIFNKLSVIVQGQSSLSMKIGCLHNAYKQLNYLLN
jgi:hypothetical protein